VSAAAGLGQPWPFGRQVGEENRETSTAALPSLLIEKAASESHFLRIDKLFINQLSSTVLAYDQGKKVRYICIYSLYKWEIISPSQDSFC